ncbi:MAG: hypothetical protein ACTHLN_05825, partial [Tepidisphaeraceae bacterium]
MRLIVLGTTNDDKGSQLETLSKELLESLGYTHIATNVANDAGELDITGDFVTPMPVAPKVEKVIGECKALKVPLSMPDWLRFLGKMFIARQGGATVNGCLIALSGVNGNVQGSFDALKLNDIQLIGSSTLIDYLQKSHGLAPQAVLNAYLSSSGLTHSSIVLAYYQRRVYWVMVYDVGRYTALTADVKYPDQPVLDTIRPLIEAELEAKEFVDLREAQAQRDLQELSQKFVLVLAMLGDGKKTATELLTEHAGAKGYYEIPDDAIHAAIATLVAEGLLVGDPDRIDFDAAAVADPEKRAAIYKKYLFRSMLVAAIGCDWWDRNIDDALLDHVLTIQIGLKLPDEDRNKAINLMRLSPGALAYALQPDGMIIHKRTIEPKVVEEDERMVEHDRARFM